MHLNVINPVFLMFIFVFLKTVLLHLLCLSLQCLGLNSLCLFVLLALTHKGMRCVLQILQRSPDALHTSRMTMWLCLLFSSVPPTVLLFIWDPVDTTVTNPMFTGF